MWISVVILQKWLFRDYSERWVVEALGPPCRQSVIVPSETILNILKSMPCFGHLSLEVFLHSTCRSLSWDGLVYWLTLTMNSMEAKSILVCREWRKVFIVLVSSTQEKNEAQRGLRAHNVLVLHTHQLTLVNSGRQSMSLSMNHTDVQEVLE